jgi:hypothetical protein
LERIKMHDDAHMKLSGRMRALENWRTGLAGAWIGILAYLKHKSALISGGP